MITPSILSSQVGQVEATAASGCNLLRSVGERRDYVCCHDDNYVTLPKWCDFWYLWELWVGSLFCQVVSVILYWLDDRYGWFFLADQNESKWPLLGTRRLTLIRLHSHCAFALPWACCVSVGIRNIPSLLRSTQWSLEGDCSRLARSI